MESLYIIIPIAICFFALATLLFIHAVNSGQFEDLEGAASRILFDEETIKEPNKTKKQKKQPKK